MSVARGNAGRLRVLLVGPCPPPHGGISVHVATARAALRRAGIPCRVLDSGGHRARGGSLAAARSLLRMLAAIDAHARRGWLVHLHTNGHSGASWCVALVGALAARRAGGRVLTLHSGLLPEFVERSGPVARRLERLTLARYHRVIPVSERVAGAIATLGVDRERQQVLPAHLVTPDAAAALPAAIEGWLEERSPMVSTALFLRPEYGLDLLLDAVARLASDHPALACVVMGDGERGAVAQARRGIAERGLDARVLLTGDLPHAVCAAVMARSDVYARPALSDGDAISVREALALGVPVVASDSSLRPAGTILHKSGDAGDLAERLGAVLAASASRGVAERRGGGSDQRGLDALLWIYRGAREAASHAGASGSSRLAARWSRLRSMSAAELRSRAGQALDAAVDRATSPRMRERRADAMVEELDRDARLERHLREVVAPRFYLPARPEERRATAELLWRRHPSWLDAAAAEAERLCRHRVELAGFGEIELGPEIDWHRDPVSGERWPLRHFASYDTVRGGRAGKPGARKPRASQPGDAKRVWELNRHQHLPRLGKAYLLFGEERYAREVVEQMLQWIDQNPIGRGIHWHSSLEIAIRALSWLWALHYVLPSPSLDEASARRIVRSLLAQLDHVARRPSIWTSPNTHLLGEAAALYIGGTLFADGASGRRWRELGKSLLEREAQRQVLPDGMHAELSPYYHCYALDFYLQALALGRRSGDRWSAATWRRVELMVDALFQLAPDGVVPLLGDDDGGRALALGPGTHYRDAGDLLCTGAAMFGRGDWKRPSSVLREETFWLLGTSAAAAWEELAPVQSASRRAGLEHAGYLIDRCDGSAAGARLVFDRGGLGELGGGHGHADALAVVVRGHGEDLLVDPGTAVYNAAPEWRAFFRSTRAHNTLAIDGDDQSTPADTFKWKYRANTRAIGEGSHDGIQWSAAEHDGYVSSYGLVHRRRVLSIDGGYWLVLDDVSPASSAATDRGRSQRPTAHRIELFWHFAPEAEVTVERAAIGQAASGGASSRGAAATVRVGGAGLHLRLEANAPLDARLVCGATAPPQGWVSRRYGERRPAPVLEARWRATGPALCITLLAPTGDVHRSSLAAGARSAPVRIVHGDGRFGPHDRSSAVALSIPHPGGEDLVVLASRGATVEAGPCRARADVLWVRSENDRPTRLLALDAAGVEVSGRPLAGAGASDHLFWSAQQRRALELDGCSPKERLHVRHRRDR